MECDGRSGPSWGEHHAGSSQTAGIRRVTAFGRMRARWTRLGMLVGAIATLLFSTDGSGLELLDGRVQVHGYA